MKLLRKSKRITVRILAKKDFDVWKEYDSSMLPKKNKWDQDKRPNSELTKSKFNAVLTQRLEAGIEGTNRRSIKLAKSLGLRKEGTKKRMVYLHGDWQDLVMYSITSEEVGIKWKGKVESRLV